jgi:hypothetical protein
MSFNELLKNYASQVLGTDVLGSLTENVPTYLDDDSTFGSLTKFAPLIIAPIASPFLRKKRSGFPMPSDFKKYRNIPENQRGMIGDYEDQGDDDFEKIELEDLPVDLSAYLTNTPTGKINIFGETMQLGPKVTKGIFGTNFATSPGKALGEFASMAGPLGAMAGTFGQQNLKQLEYITAMAGLGNKGYGVGLVNGQVVGVTPNHIVGTLPTKLSQAQRNEITDRFTGKSGAVGAGVKAMQQSFSDNFTPTPETKAYEKTIMNSTLSDDLKAQMLGFTSANYAFSPNRLQAQFGQVTPTNYKQFVSGKQYIEDITSTGRNRAGNVKDGSFTDVSTPSMGLETDIDAQQSQVNPMGINVGINMDNITGVPTGVNVPSYTDQDDNDGGGLDDSSSVDNDESSDNFGGGWTAYGGRIKKAYGGGENKGFASKTPNKITIQGVGLIKPDETFLKTDTVRDRYNLEARENDFIINGPTSEQFKNPILAFINQAETNLKNKGVDIRVGKPTIPVSKQVPLLVASSENYIPKEYIEAFNPNDPEEGYRILEAMNNVGKPEVSRLKSQIDEPTDQGKYQANEGMRVGDSRQGFLFGRPKLNLTGPNIDKSETVFVPGISDEPIEMTPNDERFFDNYSLRDIKEAIFDKEMKGYKDRGFIFTGVKPKAGKGSSAFGTMQITYSTLEDFINRSRDYKEFPKELKAYTQNVAQQGRDKVNLELHKAIYRDGKKIPLNKISKKVKTKLGRLGQGVIPQEVHKKYYNKLADAVIRQKLKDYKNKGIRPFLKSYGEGEQYGEDVYNILRDKVQIKNLDNNSSATQ